ncbi:DgyrCDS5095 [Dimorphilus gyrociliatus]|uniref:Leucine carboxyl methyltransferase 1 n=1 Tax=Dimorphilus gyrociliatus TaxID=2664684 RepID=A0A7I8VNM1_9ANNE|nr:DgyrCDS5095 [Dimorphilus gyrociliatus]
MSFNDDAVQLTNDDASSCKLSAVQRGYWKDSYISFFYENPERKSPEISIGYYTRVHSVRYLLKEFIKKTEGNCQIVNLGAGYDTTYWNLKDDSLTPKSFIEVDFPAVTMKKCRIIKEQMDLLEKLQSEEDDIQLSRTEIHSNDYHLVSADIRELKQLEAKLQSCRIDTNLPTVFITECVLVYLDMEYSDRLLKWISTKFPTSAFINYEQVNMEDRFGEVMIVNLKRRNTELRGVEACQSVDTQINRFKRNGWKNVECLEMTNVYRNLSTSEKQRLEKLERFDEKDLLDQLLEHYCLMWANSDSNSVNLSDVTITDFT